MTPSIFKILNTLGFGKRVGFIKRDGEGVVDMLSGHWLIHKRRKTYPLPPKQLKAVFIFVKRHA